MAPRSIFLSLVVFLMALPSFGESLEDCRSLANDQGFPVLMKSENLFVHPEKLSTEDSQKDIECLAFVLKNGYIGYRFVNQGSVELAIERLRQNSKEMSTQDFFQLLDGELGQIPDRHLVVFKDWQRSEKSQNQVNGTVGKNAITNPSKIWEVRIDTWNDKKVLYISLLSFPRREDQVWNGFFEKIDELSSQSDLAVIDLRQNNGGDDTYGYKMASYFAGSPIEAGPYSSQYHLQTPTAIALGANLWKFFPLALKHQNKPVDESMFRNLLDQSLDQLQKALGGQVPEYSVRNLDRDPAVREPNKGFQKRIYILMDRKCGSSCESTVDAFEGIPQVYRVGENTEGAVHFTDVGFLILPQSQLALQIATSFNQYKDGRFIEGKGIQPDIPVPNGRDAYDFLKNRVITGN